MTISDNLRKKNSGPLLVRVNYVEKSLHNKSKIVDVEKDEELLQNRQVRAFNASEKQWTLQMLSEPLKGDCEIEFVTIEDPEGLNAFWHSTAHILGSAIEHVYPSSQLTIGPAVKDGFYYDFYSPIGESAKEEDFRKIEKAMNAIVKKGHRFEQLLVTKE